MVKTALVGATGYTGLELLKILIRHPHAEIVSLSAKLDRPVRIQEEFPVLEGRIDRECAPLDAEEVADLADAIFLALPHTVSMRFAPVFLKAGKKVIDLSADYRFSDSRVYREWYGVDHLHPEGLKTAVYGLTELFRSRIASARLIANPGCYPTGTILGVYPVLAEKLIDSERIVVDAKTGVTGAGRKASLSLLFPEVNENFKAYNLTSHKHTPEMNLVLQELTGMNVEIEFGPHLLPVNRGILSTIYLKLIKPVTEEKVWDVFHRRYGGERFIRLLPPPRLPELKDVVETNNCAIGFRVNRRTNNLIVVTAIDNLLKGAAGQAVQNFNAMEGWPEETGL